MDRMGKGARRLVAVLVVCLIGLFGLSGVAAAGGIAAQVRSPKGGKAVTIGHAKFTVYVPDPADANRGNVFLELSDKRIVKRGLLESPRRCGFHCDIATMKRVGRSHLYTYVDPYHFAGNWQDTPGKYYWQAYYYPKGGTIGVLASRIATFRIIG